MKLKVIILFWAMSRQHVSNISIYEMNFCASIDIYSLVVFMLAQNWSWANSLRIYRKYQV